MLLLFSAVLLPTPSRGQSGDAPSAEVKAAERSEGDAPDEPRADPVENAKNQKNKKKIKISARIHALWEMNHENIPDDPLTTANEFQKMSTQNDFRIRRARFKMTWRPERWLSAVLQVGDFQKLDFGISLLRDAYIHVSPLRYLEIRVGQFKKPFSRLALRSSGSLRVLNRGEGNKLLSGELRYGDRDLGVQLSGRIVPSVKLDYEIGVFNGSGPNLSERGNSKDMVARLEASPVPWFRVGLSGSFKFFDAKESTVRNAWAAGADAVFKFAGFRVHLEAITGLDHAYSSRQVQVTSFAPPILDLLTILSYKHKVADAKLSVALEPVFKFEMLDPNTKVINDQVMIFSPGFNTYFGKYFRLMLQGEILRSGINGIVRYPDRETLAIQFCFDI